MSTYAPFARQATSGFGKVFTIQTPMGPQVFDVPVEDMAATAGRAAVQAAWPEIQVRMHAELPVVVDKALDRAQPRTRAEVDRAIGSAALIAVGVAAVTLGTGWWVRQGMRGR